jgi:hypothetical protein
MMEFTAKLIVGKKNPEAVIAMVGAGGLIVSVAFSIVRRYQYFGLWGCIISLLILIIGAALAKGDLTFVEISDEDLVINSAEIKVGEVIYPLGQVGDIVFDVDGYDGMPDPGNITRNGRQVLLNGMDNYLSFVLDEKKQECTYYLSGPESIQQMGLLFRDWYSKQYPFEERIRKGGRTFMFDPVSSDEDFENRKRAEGY